MFDHPHSKPGGVSFQGQLRMNALATSFLRLLALRPLVLHLPGPLQPGVMFSNSTAQVVNYPEERAFRVTFAWWVRCVHK